MDLHASDCSIHNGPAYPPGPCDCGADAIVIAVAAEREACAKIVEEEGSCRHVDHVQGFCACQDKADAIRARSKD